ncbi:alpha-tocopherol transfer protein-like [Amblyomma americanum]
MSGVYTKKCVDDVQDTSEGALSFKLQRIAEEELGGTPTRRHEMLAKLKDLLSEEEDLNARNDDQFLLRFLRVRKYNLGAALHTIRNYYRIRNTSGPVFRDFQPSKVSPATRKLMMVMPETDVHGRPILLFKPGSWILDETSHVDMHRALMLCLESLAKNPVTQTLGMVILFDYAGFTPEKLLAFNMGLLRRGVEYLQDCMPMRLEAVHTVRQGLAFDMFFTLIKPFLKTKLIQRFRLYGEKFEDLHKEISPSILSDEYGGQAPSPDFEGFWGELEELQEEYKENSAYGYIRSYTEDFATDA